MIENTIIIDNVEYTFNENAKVKRKDYIQYVNNLKPYEAFIIEKEKQEKSSSKGDISEETMKIVETTKRKINENQEAIKTRLLNLFFSVSFEAIDEFDFETYETLWAEIEKRKPNLIDFLYLPPIKKGENLTLLNNQSTLNSSQALQETSQAIVENMQN